MAFLPDEARGLPPPSLINRGSAWLGFAGWFAVLLDNSFSRRPALRSGVHRQILFTTVGWFVGYHLIKYAEYMHAKRDRELFEYVRQHPEDFRTKEKKRVGELLENFYPVR